MSALATSSAEALRGHVFRLLLDCPETQCKKRVVDVLDELELSLRQSCDISTVEDLRKFLAKYPMLFQLGNEEVTDLPAAVSLTTTLTLCGAHGARSGGSCPNGACAGLHACLFFLLSGKCPHGAGCHFGHDLGTGHNRQVLGRHLLGGVSVSELRTLLCLPQVRWGIACPQICRFYNSLHDCSRGAECHFLHLCNFHVTGQCKFKQACMRNHDIFHPQVQRVLELYGVQTKGRLSTEILKDIRPYDTTNGHRMNGPATLGDFPIFQDGPPPGYIPPWAFVGWSELAARVWEREQEPRGDQNSDLSGLESQGAPESGCLEEGEIPDDWAGPSGDLHGTREMSGPSGDLAGRESSRTSWRTGGVRQGESPPPPPPASGLEEGRGGEPDFLRVSRVLNDMIVKFGPSPVSEDNGRYGSLQTAEDRESAGYSPRWSGDTQRSRRHDSFGQSSRRRHGSSHLSADGKRRPDLPYVAEGGRRSSLQVPRGRHDSPETPEDIPRTWESPQMSGRRDGSARVSDRIRCDSPTMPGVTRGGESSQRFERESCKSPELSDSTRYDSPRSSEDGRSYFQLTSAHERGRHGNPPRVHIRGRHDDSPSSLEDDENRRSSRDPGRPKDRKRKSDAAYSSSRPDKSERREWSSQANTGLQVRIYRKPHRPQDRFKEECDPRRSGREEHKPARRKVTVCLEEGKTPAADRINREDY